VVRYLPDNTPAEYIANELLALGFKVISVRQMTSTRPQAPANLPLFLVTQPRGEKSQEIFKLNSLSHIIINMEAYRAQIGLTQCYNCQQFGHVWANCKQPPNVYSLGAAISTGNSPKRITGSPYELAATASSQKERSHTPNYRGCNRAKEELQKREAQKSQTKETIGRVFSSLLATTAMSFSEAVKGQRQQTQQNKTPRATPEGTEKNEDQSIEMGMEQPVQPGRTTGNSNLSSLDNMFKVATIVQQIMTGLNEAVSEEDKIITITKIVMKLINHEY
jgi:hypothetical protein